MGQCSNRMENKCDEEFTASLVSVEKARSLSSNSAVTATRYHCSASGGRRLQDDYSATSRVLGAGLCGEVVLANSKADRRRYALKTINKGKVPSNRLSQLATEVEIHLSLDHPNIARLQDVYETEDKIHLLTECCEGGELYYRLQKRGVYTDADAAEAMRQMLRAVAYLHSNKIVHRDLKLENFLNASDKSPQLKLIDFGFAKIWDSSTLMMASCGSIAYVSPDVLSGRGYTNKCDIWSLGVIAWMLLSGYPPFHGDERILMSKIRAGQPDWSHKQRWKLVSEQAADFVKKLLTFNPQDRPSARAALQHPWLAGTAPAQPVVLGRDLLRSLHRYAEASRARRAALQLLARELTPAEVQELQEMFLALDGGGYGTISLRDLKDAIRGESAASPGAYSPTLSPVTPARALRRADSCVIDEVCGLLDANGDERICYSDFLAATMEARLRNRDEAVRAAFGRLDQDSSGAISLEDLRAALGDTFEGKDVEELLAEAKLDGASEISFPAFVRVLEGHDASASTRTRWPAQQLQLLSGRQAKPGFQAAPLVASAAAHGGQPRPSLPLPTSAGRAGA